MSLRGVLLAAAAGASCAQFIDPWVRVAKHDRNRWTEGLACVAAPESGCQLVESSGLPGQSRVFRSDCSGNGLSQSEVLAGGAFGEGITYDRAGRRLVQVTYQDGQWLTYNPFSLQRTGGGRLPAPAAAGAAEHDQIGRRAAWSGNTEAWGLAHDPSRDVFVMSDGTGVLQLLARGMGTRVGTLRVRPPRRKPSAGRAQQQAGAATGVGGKARHPLECPVGATAGASPVRHPDPKHRARAAAAAAAAAPTHPPPPPAAGGVDRLAGGRSGAAFVELAAAAGKVSHPAGGAAAIDDVDAELSPLSSLQALSELVSDAAFGIGSVDPPPAAATASSDRRAERGPSAAQEAAEAAGRRQRAAMIASLVGAASSTATIAGGAIPGGGASLHRYASGETDGGVEPDDDRGLPPLPLNELEWVPGHLLREAAADPAAGIGSCEHDPAIGGSPAAPPGSRSSLTCADADAEIWAAVAGCSAILRINACSGVAVGWIVFPLEWGHEVTLLQHDDKPPLPGAALPVHLTPFSLASTAFAPPEPASSGAGSGSGSLLERNQLRAGMHQQPMDWLDAPTAAGVAGPSLKQHTGAFSPLLPHHDSLLLLQTSERAAGKPRVNRRWSSPATLVGVGGLGGASDQRSAQADARRGVPSLHDGMGDVNGIALCAAAADAPTAGEGAAGSGPSYSSAWMAPPPAAASDHGAALSKALPVVWITGKNWDRSFQMPLSVAMGYTLCLSPS